MLTVLFKYILLLMTKSKKLWSDFYLTGFLLNLMIGIVWIYNEVDALLERQKREATLT